MLKSAEESVSSSSTLQNDDHLKVTMAAGETWEFEVFLVVTSSSQTPDIKYTLNAPGGATVYMTNSSGAAVLTGTQVTDIAADAVVAIRLRGVVLNPTTAGDLQLQWAQNSSNGNATKVLKGSFIKAGKF